MLASFNPSISLQDIFQLECDAVTIIARCHRNLINAYLHAHNELNNQLMVELLQMTEENPQLKGCIGVTSSLAFFGDRIVALP